MVDTSHLAAIEEAITSHTRLIVVETITNPLLRVANLAALAEPGTRAKMCCCWSTTHWPVQPFAGRWSWGQIWSSKV